MKRSAEPVRFRDGSALRYEREAGLLKPTGSDMI